MEHKPQTISEYLALAAVYRVSRVSTRTDALLSFLTYCTSPRSSGDDHTTSCLLIRIQICVFCRPIDDIPRPI